MPTHALVLDRASEVTAGSLSRLPESNFWSSADEPELRVHRIHAYPAKFPSFITTKALRYAAANKRPVRRMADVFCGCGTVAYEARRNGIDFWGCDINPIATLIAQAKARPYDPAKILEYYASIRANWRRAPSTLALGDAANERLRHWFSATNRRSLAKLLNSIRISVPKRSPYHVLFLCAFSNILKPTSRWLTKSIKPQQDPDKVPATVLPAFRRQVDTMVSAWTQAGGTRRVRSVIKNANILNVTGAPRGIDMIVTSPPYVTSYEYADLHQLSTLWLGYANDYRDLRTGSIGSLHHDLEFERSTKHLNAIASKIVFSLYAVEKRLARSAAKYFIDMQKVAVRCAQLLRPQGLAVFVIGNTEYRGVRVDNAAHLAQSLLLGGFSRVRVAKRRISRKTLTPYRDVYGQFSRDSRGRQVYSEEFVLIASK